MMLLRKQSQPHRFPNKTGTERSLRRSARCAAVAPPPGSASSRKGVLRPPFDPPARRCAPWTSPRRAAFGYPPKAFRPWTLTMPFRPWTPTRGLAPATRGRDVPPSPTLPHPARMGCAPCREPAS
jgi:hypothetical protein